jgi:AhpD family alkylhydroperoxidase
VDRLTNAERELVALGAALGSNCVPCIEYHIPEARKAGLSNRQINEAVQLADKVRQVPARKVLDAALGMLPEAGTGTDTEQRGSACAQPVLDGGTKQGCCG